MTSIPQMVDPVIGQYQAYGPHQRRTAKAARAAQVSSLVCPEKDIADIESYRPVIDAELKRPSVMRDDQIAATAEKAICHARIKRSRYARKIGLLKLC